MMGGLGYVSENLFTLFQIDTLHTLRNLLKEILEKGWDHSVDTDRKIADVKSGYVIGGFGPPAQRVSENEKYVRAESVYVKRYSVIFKRTVFGAIRS